jgi:leucyl/phenylalanyl-tRNA--protein transferase
MQSFAVKELLACYARGVFPMADAREDDGVFLIDPERRGVIPLDGFHVSRRLARTVRAEPFQVRFDSAFAEVVAACATQSVDGRAETWINHPIEQLYGELHRQGHAHSVECWQDGRLVGGLYGVSLKGAFFGESMFSHVRDASKVALVHLVARLIAGGFRLLDTQFQTEHLTQFGTQEISRREYHRRLALALAVEADFQLGGLSSAGGGAAGVDSAAAGVGGVGLGTGGIGSVAGLASAGLGAAGAGLVEAPGFAASGEGLGAGGLAGATGATGTTAGLSGCAVLQVISQAS